MLSINLIRSASQKGISPAFTNSGQIPSPLGGLTQRQIDLLMGKAPLRRIVARTAVTEALHSSEPKYTITYWKEVLECGHLYTAYSDSRPQLEPTAVRRRCPECLAIVGKKKPVQSVVLPRKKRAA